MRQPGIEPGPHRWQRRILTVELLARTLHIYNNIYMHITVHQRGFEPRSSAWEADMLYHYTIGARAHMYI